MEKEQELEWLEAQKIVVSINLAEVAKKQLQFLALVDRNRCLYDGPVLHRAIFRYNNYWLPLLAKHTKSDTAEGPLVVPLDCEWVWHCHRLNPLQYKRDCEEIYGRILDNKNVVSTVEGSSKSHTEEVWTRMYPEEPYELDFGSSFSNNISEKGLGALKCTKYDLVAAVKRQVPFFYQVSRSGISDAVFLESAVGRYKGFLHLIKRNKERSIRRFCVPTYDVDLIWHSHQLNPVSYCKDLVEALGKVLEHDDTDSDRTKGQKLDNGFSQTTKQWEETFGSRYWKAGAMYRGAAPSPVTSIPWQGNTVTKSSIPSSESLKTTKLSKRMVVEVFLEIVGVKNLPEGHKGQLFVLFSKKKPDLFFNVKRRLSILSISREKQVASFQCETTGELFFELVSHGPSILPTSRPSKTMGTTSIPLQCMLDPSSKLSVERWFDLESSSGAPDSKPISLRIAVSVSPPEPAPRALQIVRSRPLLKNSCFFSLTGNIQHAKSPASVIDEVGDEIISIKMRDSKKATAKNMVTPKEIIGIVGLSGETHVLAESIETEWYFMDSSKSFRLQKKCGEDGHIFELSGNRVVRLYSGRKLDYESKGCQSHKIERDFITAVEFSAEHPYGNAVALLNMKSGVLKVKEDWFMVSGITLNFILSNILRKEGYGAFTVKNENSKMSDLMEATDGCDGEGGNINEMLLGEDSGIVTEKGVDEEKLGNAIKVKSGGCGSGCGGRCGTMVKSGGCGSGCGGGCGTMVKSGGCGSGCGSGCGKMVNSGGCGSGCGSGCGKMVNSAGGVDGVAMAKSGGYGGGCGGGCGSGCGSGCGKMVSSAECAVDSVAMAKSGGCGGGACGMMVKSGGSGTISENTVANDAIAA